MSVSLIFKKAAVLGRLDGERLPDSRSAKLGFAISCLHKSLPSEGALEKISSRTRIPKRMIKLAVLRQVALNPLFAGLAMGSIPLLGIPAYRGAKKALGGKKTPDSMDAPSMSSIGGLGPTELLMFNKMIAREALRNYQTQSLLNQMRMASGPIFSGPMPGQSM